PIGTGTCPGCELAIRGQDVPSHRCVIVRFSLDRTSTNSPTAQTALEPCAVTPRSWLFTVPWFGVSTTLHVAPSQCSASVRSDVPLSSAYPPPTARTSAGDTAATLWRQLVRAK